MTTTTTTTESPAIDLEDAEALASELLRALTPHAGNPDAVNATLAGYVDHLGPSLFAAVCMVAVRDTFAACLTPTPLDQAPPGALALVPPTQEADPR